MRIGIDLGGTKISAIALSDSGEELCRQRVATPANQGVQAIVAAICFSDHVVTQLLPPVHGDDGGVRGAAWLWND